MSEPRINNNANYIKTPADTHSFDPMGRPVPPVLIISGVEAVDYDRDVYDDEEDVQARIHMNSGTVHTIVFPTVPERNTWIESLLQRKAAAR